MLLFARQHVPRHSLPGNRHCRVQEDQRRGVSSLQWIVYHCLQASLADWQTGRHQPFPISDLVALHKSVPANNYSLRGMMYNKFGILAWFRMYGQSTSVKDQIVRNRWGTLYNVILRERWWEDLLLQRHPSLAPSLWHLEPARAFW